MTGLCEELPAAAASSNPKIPAVLRRFKLCQRLQQNQMWPGEAWARPRLGRKTYWHKDKARLMRTRNYIILLLKSQGVPVRLNLK